MHKYRTMISRADSGVFVVERQWHAGSGDWRAIDSYVTGDLAVPPKRVAEWIQRVVQWGEASLAYRAVKIFLGGAEWIANSVDAAASAVLATSGTQSRYVN